MQWIVIAVLVLGGGTAVLMASSKAGEYKDKYDGQQSNIASLREQLRQAKNPAPDPQPPLPDASGRTQATPTPASKTPAPTKLLR